MSNNRPLNFRVQSSTSNNHIYCAGNCPNNSSKSIVNNTEQLATRTSFYMETARNIKIYSTKKGKKYNVANRMLNQYGSWAGAPYGYGAPITNRF